MRDPFLADMKMKKDLREECCLLQCLFASADATRNRVSKAGQQRKYPA
jgi:hypothetical protein